MINRINKIEKIYKHTCICCKAASKPFASPPLTSKMIKGAGNFPFSCLSL